MSAVGALNTPLTLSAPTTTLKGDGGDEAVYLAQAQVWAKVEAAQQSAGESAGRLEEQNRFRVTIRAGVSVEAGWKLSGAGLDLTILSVVDVDQRGRFLMLMCREETP
ncbi:phage head closure protein [Pseudovibrio sp. SPO723]|uniref:phage head closure protein n=1 Tax=Nesiotobacter zosterae TaxID=392721 RepID=UPI0029C54EB2|nr:phage head closure protein [Pseudovibrio sp. SPO723]MDX5595587.1 phage head closure protein [Pseudovibrio sp. SPO723]